MTTWNGTPDRAERRPVLSKPWWEPVALERGETRFWEIGPVRLWATRMAQEWRVSTRTGPDPLAADLSVAPGAGPPVDDDAAVTRYGFGDTPRLARLLPATADRPVVVESNSPFVVPGGEEVTLFMNGVLWLRFGVSESRSPTRPGLDLPPDPLLEMPFFRPSDTWFGRSTTTGELCYASRTAARFDLDKVPRQPHRAITRIQIRNRASRELLLEKLKIPVPHLSLFADESGHLWTESVTLEREEVDGTAKIRISDRPPDLAGRTTLVAGPRVSGRPGLLERAFGNLRAAAAARGREVGP